MALPPPLSQAEYLRSLGELACRGVGGPGCVCFGKQAAGMTHRAENFARGAQSAGSPSANRDPPPIQNRAPRRRRGACVCGASRRVERPVVRRFVSLRPRLHE